MELFRSFENWSKYHCIFCSKFVLICNPESALSNRRKSIVSFNACNRPLTLHFRFSFASLFLREGLLTQLLFVLFCCYITCFVVVLFYVSTLLFMFFFSLNFVFQSYCLKENASHFGIMEISNYGCFTSSCLLHILSVPSFKSSHDWKDLGVVLFSRNT